MFWEQDFKSGADLLAETAKSIEGLAEPCAARMPADERRKQLIRVAIDLFSERGFSGTTTKEIAAAASVNEAIIFRHFARKEDLYAAILDYKATEGNITNWLDELKERADANDDEGLLLLVSGRILEHYRRDPGFLRLMLFSALEGHELAKMFRQCQVKPIYEFLRDYIARRQRDGVFRAGVDPGAAVRAFVGMPSYHALVTSLFGSDMLTISDEQATATFTKIMLDGLRKHETA